MEIILNMIMFNLSTFFYFYKMLTENTGPGN